MASDPLQYTIGKGIVSFTPTGGTKTDLGNVSKFSAQLNVTKLDHFSSRTGTKTKDRSVVLEKSIAISMTLDEWTEFNLGMALFGAAGGTIDIGSEAEVTGALEFVGSNDIGAKVTLNYFNVSFTPNSAIDFIGEDWATLELSGEALVAPSGTNAGKFGTAAVVAAVAAGA
jgi:hypothetical protein